MAGIIFIFFGCIIAAFTVQGYYYGKLSESWPSVDGTITSSKMSNYKGTLDIHVTYNYSVDNVEYNSNRLAYLKPSIETEKVGYEYLEKYAEGKTVKVYYNPEDHAEAVLEPGLCDTFELVAGTIGIIIFMIAGVWTYNKGRKMENYNVDEEKRKKKY